MPEGAPLLRIRGLQKSYAVPVLTDVDFDVLPGQVHALVGANGAGKSTLCRVVCGLTLPDSVSMALSGRPYLPRTKGEAEQEGVHVVMQELNLIPTLTVAENLFLNHMPRRFGFIDYRRMHEKAEDLLERVGLTDVDPRTAVARLGVGEQQLVEIAGVLARKCRLLILDEPTAALADPQIDLLFRQVERLKVRGVGVIYVSHRMDEIRRISDHVTVLRDGHVVASEPAAGFSVDRIVQLMAGRQVLQHLREDRRPAGSVAMRVEKLSRGNRVREVSFEAYEGEVLGFAGLIGSGRTETMRALFGADVPSAGEVFLGKDAAPVRIRAPRDAVRVGIGMIPEDRKGQGLLLTQSIRANVSLARMRSVMGRFGWVREKVERETALRYHDALDVRSRSVEQPANELSGGNQQKVVLARWLLRDPKVLLFDEPTRGIDVGAKETIYRLLDELAAAGKALVVVSSDLRELMLICDRIAVMSAGRLVAIFDRGDWDEERLMAAAVSGYLDVRA